jgi:hypothetical protein
VLVQSNIKKQVGVHGGQRSGLFLFVKFHPTHEKDEFTLAIISNLRYIIN